MKLLFAACAAAAFATLGACSRSAEASSAGPGVELPAVAAGKWRWTQSVDGKGGDFPAERCFPERSIWEVIEVGAAGIKSCDRSIETDGARFIARHHCKTGRAIIDILTTVSGDFTTSFRLESVQTLAPPAGGDVVRQTISIRAERLAGAACS